MRKLIILLFLLIIPNLCFAKFGGGEFGDIGSASGGSASITCADGGALYAHPANTPICSANDYYYDYTNKVLHVPSVQTAATNTPYTQYSPNVTGDTIWTVGDNGNGNGSSDDHYVISEGSTLGSANRIDIAPGGVVTIPSLSVTTINSSTVTSSSDTLVNRNTAETLSNKTLTSVVTINSSTIVTSSDTLVNRNNVETLSNKRYKKRVIAVTQSATPTINTDLTDQAQITGLAQAITSFTTNLSGTPNPGDTLSISVTDNGTGRALTFGTSFEASTVALPTTTVASTRLDMVFTWNTATSKWRIVGVS